jgi:acetoacetyl-CoA synthetase
VAGGLRSLGVGRGDRVVYPGVWRHGDWIEITGRGTAIIYGRSDSTINRGGVRMGTAEIYRAVLDAWIELFVVLADGGVEVTDELRKSLARRIRERCSPRHVPDEVQAIAEVPRTLSGKVTEVPEPRRKSAGVCKCSRSMLKQNLVPI